MELPSENQASQPNIQSPTAQPVPDQQITTQAPFETPQSSRPKIFLIVIVTIVFLIGGGLLGYISVQKSILQDYAPSSSTSQVLPTDGAESQTAVLSNVSGGGGNGKATRTYIPGKPAIMKFSITTNLPSPAAEGEFYQVWLVEDVNDLATWVPLSILWKDGNGYSMEDEYRLPSEPPPLTSYYAYDTMVITLETGDSSRVTSDDGEVGPKVLEGSFTR